MNRVLGIIAEYDPFHKGHEYHLQESVRQVCLKTGCEPDEVIKIAVISGNFTQRGEPAIVDKWARAEMAMAGGFDLIAEIPVIYAVNNAGYFAKGGVEILEALGAEYIAFGSETADVEALLEACDRREKLNNDQEQRLKAFIKEGYSYPRALAEVLGEDEGPGPNDLLAVEYIRRMTKAEPLAIQRKGPSHGDLLEEEDLASATLIRKRLLNGESPDTLLKAGLIPEFTAAILEREKADSRFTGPEDLYQLINSRIAASDDDFMQGIYGAEEGLGNKLKNEFRYAGSWEGQIDLLKSKRYTRTRVQRVLIHTLLGISRERVKASRNYIRLLALNDRGAEHIKTLKKSGGPDLPLIANFRKDMHDHPEIRDTAELDVLAADIYNTALRRDLYSHSEYVKKPLKY